MRVFFCAAITAAVLFMGSSSACASGVDTDALSSLNRMQRAYGGVKDYTANFLKQERVNGELLPQENVYLKYKKPASIYMKWLKGPDEGREALYVAGANGNNLVGHEGGFTGFVTLNLDPNGSLAMKGNRHPITDVGIGRLIDIVMGEVQKSRKAGEGSITLSSDKVFGKPAQKVVVAAPPVNTRGYYARKSEIWIDPVSGLPLQIKVYGWNMELLESYGYRDLKINPGLSDREFERDFPGYNF